MKNMKKIISVLFSGCILLAGASFTAFGVRAADVSDMYPDDSTYELIKELEGFNSECYWDNKQWTIGYGNKCPYGHSYNGSRQLEKGGHTISESDARDLFHDKLTGYVNTLKSNCSGLSMNQNQFNALLSATYNHGNVQNCPLKYYLQGNLSAEEAYSQYCEWYILPGSIYENGLRNRRRREADYFFDGIGGVDEEFGIPYSRPTGKPNIKLGSKGNDVGWLQYALHEILGYDIGYAGVDCDFGSGTLGGVKDFQSDNDLDVDGIAGPATVAKLVERCRDILYPPVPDPVPDPVPEPEPEPEPAPEPEPVPQETAPSVSILQAAKTSLLIGEPVTFTASSNTAALYTIGVDLENERKVTEAMPNGILTLSFDKPGSYSAYVTSYNTMGYVDSERICFTVTSDLKLKNGSKLTLPYTGQAYTYQSGNPDIAVVSTSGVITALGNGTAIISVIDQDLNVTQLHLTVTPAHISGDCNGNGEFDAVDVVLLQKWLLNAPDAVLADWEAVDFDADGQIDVFDLCLMKRELLM